jgi:uncharacterized protein
MTTRRSIRLVRLARLARTLHIYLTMFAFLMMLFFAVTGFVLNHEDWFTQWGSSHRDVHGTIAVASLAGPDRLQVVEALRSSFGAVGAVSTFDVDTNSVHVEMKGPGRQVDAEINRSTGATDVSIELKGIAVRLDDLHRGKDSGRAWSLIIDASALLLLLGSLTGIIMWFTLPRRRKLGMISLAGGIAVCGVIYFVWVP